MKLMTPSQFTHSLRGTSPNSIKIVSKTSSAKIRAKITVDDHEDVLVEFAPGHKNIFWKELKSHTYGAKVNLLITRVD